MEESSAINSGPLKAHILKIFSKQEILDSQ